MYGLLSDNVDAMLYSHYMSLDNFEDGDGNETFGAEGDVYNILGKIGFEPSDLHRFELSYDLYRDSGDYSPRPDMSGGANEGLSEDILLFQLIMTVTLLRQVMSYVAKVIKVT